MPYKTQDARRVVFPAPRIVVSYHVLRAWALVLLGKVSPQNRTAIIQGSRFVYLYRSHNEIEKVMLPLRMKAAPWPQHNS